jgi:hypothetical protein
MKKKKPTLTLVVPTAANLAAPPANLGRTGATLWRTITQEYRIEDSGGLEMLRQICAAADRAAECAEQITADGTMIRTATGYGDHPLLKTELACRSFVVRSLHRLGLEIQPSRDAAGRPSGTFSLG